MKNNSYCYISYLICLQFCCWKTLETSVSSQSRSNKHAKTKFSSINFIFHFLQYIPQLLWESYPWNWQWYWNLVAFLHPTCNLFFFLSKTQYYVCSCKKRNIWFEADFGCSIFFSSCLGYTSFRVNSPLSNTLWEVVPHVVSHKQHFACITEPGPRQCNQEC